MASSSDFEDNGQFAIGNRASVGYGRPTELFTDDEIDQLGKDLLAWMEEKDQKNEPVVFLSLFYSNEKSILREEWQALSRCKRFLPYYEKATSWLSTRLLTKNQIKESYGNRVITMYCKDLDSHEEHKQYRQIDYKIKKEAEQRALHDQSPNDALITQRDRNIQLEADNIALKKRLDELERKANSELCSSDPQI